MGPASALARSGASSSCERANTVARVPLESFSHPWSENNSRQLGRRGCGGWVPRVPAGCDLACRAVVTTGGSGYASKPPRRRWRFYRTVLFATEGAKSQVLLAVSAFTKKTQKTPVAEIRLAERRLADWRRRGRRR